MLLGRLPVNNSKLLTVKFLGESKVIQGFVTTHGVGASNPHVVQGSVLMNTCLNLKQVCDMF